jgi:hypothetical protein
MDEGEQDRAWNQFWGWEWGGDVIFFGRSKWEAWHLGFACHLFRSLAKVVAGPVERIACTQEKARQDAKTRG